MGLAPGSNDQQQLGTGCWMRPTLPVRAGGVGAGLGLEILLAWRQSPTALLLFDRTKHELHAAATA